MRSHRNVVSLKGLNGTRDTESFYPGSAPRNKVKAYSCFRLYCLGFDYQGANTLDLVLGLLFHALTRRRVTPLYTQVDARRLTESLPAHTQHVRLGDKTKLSLTYKLNICRFMPVGLKSPMGLGRSISLLHEPPSSTSSWAFSL